MSLEFDQLFKEIMKLGDGVALDSISQSTMPGWDSLRHAELIIKTQKKFGIRFEMKEVLLANSYRQIADLVTQKTAGR